MIVSAHLRPHGIGRTKLLCEAVESRFMHMSESSGVATQKLDLLPGNTLTLYVSKRGANLGDCTRPFEYRVATSPPCSDYRILLPQAHVLIIRGDR